MSEENKALLIGIACAFVVTAVAFRLDGIGAPGWNDFRWFIAGTSCAAMVINVWAFWRTMRYGREWQRSKDRMTAEIADAVQRELRRRGIEGEVDISDRPPFPPH